MTRHSKVVSPVLILDLISGEDDLEVQEEVPLEHLPESVLQDVIRISRWLVEYGRNQGEVSWGGGVQAAGPEGVDFALCFFNPPAFLLKQRSLVGNNMRSKSTAYVSNDESS